MDEQKSGCQIFVENMVKELKNQEICERFSEYVQHPIMKKVSMRVDYDIYRFYLNTGIGYQTAMNIALRIVKEAVENGSFKLK